MRSTLEGSPPRDCGSHGRMSRSSTARRRRGQAAADDPQPVRDEHRHARPDLRTALHDALQRRRARAVRSWGSLHRRLYGRVTCRNEKMVDRLVHAQGDAVPPRAGRHRVTKNARLREFLGGAATSSVRGWSDRAAAARTRRPRSTSTSIPVDPTGVDAVETACASTSGGATNSRRASARWSSACATERGAGADPPGARRRMPGIAARGGGRRTRNRMDGDYGPSDGGLVTSRAGIGSAPTASRARGLSHRRHAVAAPICPWATRGCDGALPAL